MARDLEGMELLKNAVPNALEAGRLAMAMDPDDMILAVIQKVSEMTGVEPSSEHVRSVLLSAADWYDALAAAARKRANGPQLRLVKPDDQ